MMVNPKGKTKEAIILAIDIGKNSSQRDSDGKTYFEKSINCASTILKRKILAGSGDHLALILFGSSHTINHLSSQGCCYGNIETIAGLGAPTWDLFNRVNSVSPTNITHSDWISTFVLAADMLKNETENESFTGLHIVMFSNLATDISFSNIDIIAACLKTENINLTIIGKDCEAISLDPAFDVFIKKTEATAVNFDLILPKLSYYNQKEVAAKSWNAPLSFGDVFDIKVFGYEKIDVTTKSSNWLFSKDYDTLDSISEKKKLSDEIAEKMDIDNELPIDDFYSGDEIKPIINSEIDDCTYIVSSQKCLQVLGFTKTTNTQSSFLMSGGSHIFKPHQKDIIAFNAIFDSMVEREEVMLVRKVDLFINLLNIGALFPQKEDNEKFFVYVNLPHVENKYKFPSLDPIESHLKQKIVSFKNIDEMDVDIDGNKFVMPENKYDFELQSLYDCIVHNMLSKIIPEKTQCLNPSMSIMENSELPLKKFIKTFSLKTEVSENSSVKDNNTIKFAPGDELEVSKQDITPLDLIDDLNKFSKNGFSAAIVCRRVQYVTLNLIKLSSSLEDLMKPIANLKALREYYIINNDVQSYNNFMHHVKDAILLSSNEDVWSKFINSGIGLITNQEIEASDISQELSEEFMKLSGDFDIDFNIDADNPMKELL